MKKSEETKNDTLQVITINGKEYPCFRTMAANFDYKDITGKDVNRLDTDSVTDMLTYMWACLRGACRRMNVKFPYESPRELSVWLDESHIERWSELMNSGDDDKKK